MSTDFTFQDKEKTDNMELQKHNGTVTVDVELVDDQSDVEEHGWLENLQYTVLNYVNKHKKSVRYTVLGLLTLLYLVYLITAMVLDLHRATGLVVITLIFVTIAVYYKLKRTCGEQVERRILSPLSRSLWVKDFLKW